MAVFSTNQVRHLYVAKKVGTEIAKGQKGEGTLPDVGDILPLCKDGKYLYFKYRGNGGPIRSDLIKIDSIKWARHTPAAVQKRKLAKVTVTLNDDYLIADGDNKYVVPGQDYILRIVFRQFAGMSDEDVYIKYGLVHGRKSMKAEEFYKTMAESLEKNFSRELTQLLKFSHSAAGLVIEELEQDWILGTKQQVPVYFEVIPTTITYDGEEVIWGKATVGESVDTIPNSKALADLEYFCMGERADIYRNVGWPNVIPTQYLVDGTDPDGYDVLDIHYYYEGEGENPQKSEKDITIIAKAAVMGTKNTANTIIKLLADAGVTPITVKANA